MSINHFVYFVATAESGQVGPAAQALTISQSAVTAAVKEVGAEVGAILFHRTANGMERTEAGREFPLSGYAILHKLDEALRLTRRGRISVAASDRRSATSCRCTSTGSAASTRSRKSRGTSSIAKPSRRGCRRAATTSRSCSPPTSPPRSRTRKPRCARPAGSGCRTATTSASGPT